MKSPALEDISASSAGPVTPGMLPRKARPRRQSPDRRHSGARLTPRRAATRTTIRARRCIHECLFDKLPGAVLAALLLGGCASLSRDHGFDTVQRTVKERTGAEVQWIRTDGEQAQALAASRKLLSEPLTPEAAVQVALLNNRGLRSVYADLGIAEADLVQAGRLRNPGFSYARLRRGDELEIERTFLLNVLGLLTMPIRTDLERRRFEITQTRVASEVLQVAADTRRTYYRAVAAQESRGMRNR